MQGCLNTDEPSGYDPYEFLNKDIESIQAYLEDNNIDAEMDSSTGIFVQYHSKGDGYRTLNGVEIEAEGEPADARRGSREGKKEPRRN